MVVGQQRTASSAGSHVHPDAILVVEIVDSDIYWTEPRDLNFDEMSFRVNDRSKPSISSHHVHGAMAVFADGGVRFLDESTDPEVIRAVLTASLQRVSGRTER
jgi:hypothetical protein